jgi:hypothetical protein
VAAVAEGDVPWYREIAINGLVSASYVANFNSPPSHTNQFRLFDTDSGSIRLDLAQLVFQREAAAPGRIGFRTDFLFGPAAGVTAAAGLFRDESGAAGNFDLLQAYLGYIAPIGRGIRFDAGKFTTHIGYEVVANYDGFNDTLSHSFLCTLAEPVSHTGLRVSYPFTERVSAQLLVVNGWDNAVDNNGRKSIGAQLEVAPTPRTSLVVAYLGGPEQDDDTANARHTVDAYALTRVGRAATLALNYVHGREEQVAIAEAAGGGRRDASWQGVAGYVRYQFWPRLAATMRAEWFDDPQGARTGYVQSLWEVTLSPEFRPHPRLVLRADLRHDRSSEAVFELSDGTFGTSQVTLGVNALVVF